VQEVIVLGIPMTIAAKPPKPSSSYAMAARPSPAEEIARLSPQARQARDSTAVDSSTSCRRTPVGKLSRHELRMQQSPPHAT